ncbi:unnamed protein product [Adineta ricciae]|nr:unnamed protein product [Adineta ricciae]
MADQEDLHNNNDSQAHTFGSSFLNLPPVNRSPRHDRQTFRTAFVHSAAILFILCCGGCAILAYQVLEPFLRSILWSVLAGAFLFPLKNHLTFHAREYLRQLDTDSHVLLYGLFILLPLRTLDRTIESIGPLCFRNWRGLLFVALFTIIKLLLQSEVLYGWDVGIFSLIINGFVFFVHKCDSVWITTLVIAYLIAVIMVYDSSPLIKSLLNIIAVPVWFILFIYLSQVLPVTYRWIVIILSIVLITVGFIVDSTEHLNRNVDQPNDTNDQPSRAFIFAWIRSYFATRQTADQSPTTALSSAVSAPYFTFVLWSLVAIKVYRFYGYLISILLFVVIYKIIKFLLIKTYDYLIRQESVQYVIQQAILFLQVRRDVLTPSPLSGLVRCLIKGDKKVNYGLQESIDYLVSAFMIVTLLVSALLGTILLLIQIHHESIHMVRVTSNLINETITLHQSFQYMLPDKEHVGQLMDSAVNNFYFVGRNWITKQINVLDQNHSLNAKLEEEILQLWDRMYSYMMNTSTILSPNENRSAILYSPSNHTLIVPNVLSQMQTNFDFHLHDAYRLIRDNLGLLRTVLDSIWTNTTLVLTLLSTIVSLLFTGGFALFNFLVSFFVFVTLLFYLLSHSDQPIYRPTEWLNNTLAIGERGLGKAVNDAVTSVFIASLKIAAFYGLYTYVLHTAVSSNLVFLPAVIASICAVILKSYWAALPGCLDLWLVQQRPIVALVLLLGQIAPTYVVDTAIYSEVKGGGHQYLTALAIAGGVYYRGIEGALIGPIVLCCLLVGVKLYNETMATTASSTHEQDPSTP